MLAATVIGILLIPGLYALFGRIAEMFGSSPRKPPEAAKEDAA